MKFPPPPPRPVRPVRPMKIELSLQANSLESLLTLLNQIYEGVKNLKVEEKTLVKRQINIVNGLNSYNLKISSND